MQCRSGGSFRLAQRRQVRCEMSLQTDDFGLFAGTLGNYADGEVARMFGVADFLVSAGPAQMRQRGFGLAYLRRHGAVADRLPCLTLQRIHLTRQLPDDVFEAGEGLLSGPQPQPLPVAAGVQPRNPRRPL